MNTERLLQMADHLERGQLGHQIFDLRFINCDIDKQGQRKNVYACGTNGCACGEAPFIWPKRFVFINGDIVDLENRCRNFEAMEHWLEINEYESEFLFVPAGHCDLNNHDEDFDQSILLDSTATKEQVAERIRKFVELGGIYE